MLFSTLAGGDSSSVCAPCPAGTYSGNVGECGVKFVLVFALGVCGFVCTGIALEWCGGDQGHLRAVLEETSDLNTASDSVPLQATG